MGLIIGLIKRILKLAIYFLIFAAIIVLIPNLPPYTKFTSIKIEPTLQKVGPLAPNDALNNVQQLYKGKVLGPEAFQVADGDLYTSLATGEIVKVSGSHVTFVTKIGSPCTGLTQEHICGRPLGFQIAGRTMYVSDAYHGIWKVDLNTDKKQLLVSPRVEINKKRPMLFNSVVLDKKGNIYWTDSSTDVTLKDGAYSIMLDPSGRLLQYDAAKNESKVLMDKIWFANGVTISPDDTFVVVAETMAYRLLKYYINGPKKGQSEVFIAGLPGTPDNIRALPDGSGLLVALYTSFDDDNVLLTKSMSETPIVRKFLARLQRLIEIPFEFLNNMYPHILFEEIIYYIGHFKSCSAVVPPGAGLLQLDWNGNIIAAYYNTDNTLAHVSDAIVYNDQLYMGHPHGLDFIGSVPAPALLKKAFTPVTNVPKQPKVQTKPVEQPKVKLQEPKVQAKEAPKVTKPAAEASKVAKPTAEAPKVVKPATEAPKVAKPITEAPKVAKPAAEAPKVAKPAAEAPKVAKPAAEAPKVAKPTPEAPKVAKPATEVPKATTEKPVEPKPTVKPAQPTAKPDQKTPPPKTEQKTTPPPQPKTQTPKTADKPQEQKEAASPKTAQNKKDSPTANTVQSDAKKQSKPAPEQIPIEENIPSDTVKPNKETLKVIKKGGPTEIPNPSL